MSMDGDMGAAWDCRPCISCPRGWGWEQGMQRGAGPGEHMAAQVPASVQTHMGETGNCTDPFQLAPSWLPCLFVFWYTRLAGIFNI